LAIILAGCASLYGQRSPHNEEMRFDCSECHMSANWKDIRFEHQRTGFALEGAHARARCTGCHAPGDFAEVNTDCASCHIDVHQGKLAPSCGRCHTPRGWAVFNTLNAHAGTSFPLLGPHARLDCKACHISEIEGEFSFIKSECYFCHQDDFEAAANPSHTLMSFGTRCEECHFPISWQPANFARHDAYFPITKGAHAGAWDTCRDCHPDMQDHGIFDCLGCHAHEQSRMIDKHDEVGGFVYESNACYACHQRGEGGD
jgi:hypothetical protein